MSSSGIYGILNAVSRSAALSRCFDCRGFMLYLFPKSPERSLIAVVVLKTKLLSISAGEC